MGWFLVCFDLPTNNKKERRNAYRFRRHLLKQGYSMVQQSIYSRSYYNAERAEQFIKDIKVSAPTDGNIQMLTLTEQQWQQIVHIGNSGYQNSKYKQEPAQPTTKQIAFW
ncbi:CRISPR-associated protein Cas2 [Candidatus Termititenax persephonae]|uniref:CRISPR-associated endoribonuclease Cas2 n=1 Tax=Candidatus Termititenax persephonae TaxID=2218525 RepID=A0A388TJS1_9BACT|nr:CRISPR-associated protein Cas2 [Candidatus Termititenax persephonae]